MYILKTLEIFLQIFTDFNCKSAKRKNKKFSSVIFILTPPTFQPELFSPHPLLATLTQVIPLLVWGENPVLTENDCSYWVYTTKQSAVAHYL